MRRQYSDSSAASLTLAFDTGSAISSLALGRGGVVAAERAAAGGRSSARLLAWIDETLSELGLEARAIERVLAAGGPGSFTGLRVGLATALGLHQALGVPATAVGTLAALARSAADDAGDRPVVAVVDALRGEWYSQSWRHGRAEGEPGILAPAALAAAAPCRIVGFGVAALAAELGDEPVELVEAAPLAPVLLEMAGEPDLDWDPGRLVEPMYLRPAAAQAPTAPRA